VISLVQCLTQEMIKKQARTNSRHTSQNADLEEIKFRDMSQNEVETIDSFHIRLRQRSVNCEFPDVDQEIGTRSYGEAKHKTLRTYAIGHPGKSLPDVYTYARALEVSTEHI